jgi:nitrogen fixation NifU-like protein
VSDDDLQALYSRAILEHSRHPRHASLPPAKNRRAAGDNPLCGDRVELALSLSGERVEAFGHLTSGCAICIAAASAMGDAVLHKSQTEIAALCERYRAALERGQLDPELGALAVFAGAARFPLRRRCALLAWDVLERALQGETPPRHAELPPNTSSR